MNNLRYSPTVKRSGEVRSIKYSVERQIVNSRHKTTRTVSQPKTVVTKPEIRNVSSKPQHIKHVYKDKQVVSKSGFDLYTPKRNHKEDPKYLRNKEKINAIKDIGKNRILVMIAPGPSILEAPIEKFLKNPFIDLMTINKPDTRLWPTKYWLFCDATQHKRNVEAFDNYNGLLINSHSIKVTGNNQIKIKNLNGHGFSRDVANGFYIGRSSTYAAMQVALWMNYDKIYIFGLDMGRVGGKLHSYGTNPDVPEEVRVKRFEEESKYYNHGVNLLNDSERERFVVCSTYNKWSFVDKLQRMSQKTAVDHIINEAKIKYNGDK